VGISVVVSGECSDNAIDLYLRYWIFFTTCYDVEIFVVYQIFFQTVVITSSCTPRPFSSQELPVHNSHLSLFHILNHAGIRDVLTAVECVCVCVYIHTHTKFVNQNVAALWDVFNCSYDGGDNRIHGM